MILYLEFDRLVRALARAKVPFAVAGGVAVGFHGYVRATKDIDLLVLPENLDQVRKVIFGMDYRENAQTIVFRNSGWSLHRFFRRDSRHQDLFIIDVMLPNTPETAAIIRRARRRKYSDIRVPVVTHADLVKMKRQRGSKQDEADIEQMRNRSTPM